MAIGLAALGLLAFLLGCSGTFAEPQNSEPAAKCSLTGTWKSDRGNIIKIHGVSDQGLFRGVFYVVLRYSIHTFPSPLEGIQDQGRQPIFGFIVGITTLFVGQCLVDENGKEQLRTIWLKREKGESETKHWGVIRVGSSTFYHIK